MTSRAPTEPSAAVGDRLDPAQLDGLVDMDPEAFRAAAHAVVDLMADYLAGVEDYPVLPPIEPGSIRPQFPSAPPDRPEPLAAILADYRSIVEPNATHWQHPGFFAYFGSTASEPGILGEMLAAALGQNPMLWRTSPIGTELEGVVVDWLRQALGLPAVVRRAPDRHGLDVVADRAGGGARGGRRSTPRPAGWPGATDLGSAPGSTPRAEAHSLDREGVHDARASGGPGSVRIADRRALRLRVDALEAAIADDRAAGLRPIAIVATLGTTGSTSVDPVEAIADDRRSAKGLWLHVDAAYAGAVALDARARADRSPAGSGRTRSSSTRTSGCSRRSTHRSC